MTRSEDMLGAGRVVVAFLSRREVIMGFPRQRLEPGRHYTIATIPLSGLPPPPTRNAVVPLLRFIVDPAIERVLLVKAAIYGKERTSKEFITAALLRQLQLGEVIDPRVPIELEFQALEPLVLDCGLVCRVSYEES